MLLPTAPLLSHKLWAAYGTAFTSHMLKEYNFSIVLIAVEVFSRASYNFILSHALSKVQCFFPLKNINVLSPNQMQRQNLCIVVNRENVLNVWQNCPISSSKNTWKDVDRIDLSPINSNKEQGKKNKMSRKTKSQ